jgi:hypothetical protein
VPIERLLQWQPHHQATISGEPVGPTSTTAQFAGRGSEHLAHVTIELADAPESGRERHLGDGQVRVVQESTGEVGATRPGQHVRGDTEVFVEHAPQVTRGYRQTRAQGFLGAVIQHSVDDELHRPAYELGRMASNGAEHTVRAAAQAGAETRSLSTGG